MRKFLDFLQLAGRSIVHRKMRSWLTVIGVFIGITAVVALISLGLGFEKTITDQVSQIFGVDTFIIVNENAFGGGPHGGSADEYALDLDLLKSIEGVKVAAALREHNGFVEGGLNAEGKPIQGIYPVMGLSPELLTDFESFTGELKVMPGGRLFEPGDVEVTVLDYEVSQDLGVGVGDTVFIAGDEGAELNLTVIGIMAPPDEEKSESEGGFGMQFSSGSEGSTISVPYETMDLLWGPADDVLVTLVRTEPGYDVDEVADEAEEALQDRGSDISAVTYGDISDQIGQFTGIASAVLAGIAGISLLVGGVGVMNTMFTSILERTKEIGVMKAVGAKNSHIMLIFLIESGLMGLVGGIVGVVLGIGADVLFTSLINGSGAFMGNIEMAIVVSPSLILITLLGSFSLGAFAGLWPARRASKL
ncbi:MAG: ABC transporter permease, partial [Candidatus Bipolaricaulia bacterium]